MTNFTATPPPVRINLAVPNTFKLSTGVLAVAANVRVAAPAPTVQTSEGVTVTAPPIRITVRMPAPNAHILTPIPPIPPGSFVLTPIGGSSFTIDPNLPGMIVLTPNP